MDNIQGIGGIGGGGYGKTDDYAQTFGNMKGAGNAGAAQGQQQGQPPQKPDLNSLVQNISSMLDQGMDTNAIAQQLEQTMPEPPPPPEGQQGQQAQQPPPKPDLNSLVENVKSMKDQGMDTNAIAQQLEQTMPQPPQGGQQQDGSQQFGMEKLQFSQEGLQFMQQQQQ
jgi:hypothetical protein